MSEMSAIIKNILEITNTHNDLLRTLNSRLTEQSLVIGTLAERLKELEKEKSDAR